VFRVIRLLFGRENDPLITRNTRRSRTNTLRDHEQLADPNALSC